jgi:hypothetical protein
MSCDRIAVYVKAGSTETYKAPVREGVTPPKEIFHAGNFYSLQVVMTSELVPTPAPQVPR